MYKQNDGYENSGKIVIIDKRRIAVLCIVIVIALGTAFYFIGDSITHVEVLGGDFVIRVYDEETGDISDTLNWDTYQTVGHVPLGGSVTVEVPRGIYRVYFDDMHYEVKSLFGEIKDRDVVSVGLVKDVGEDVIPVYESRFGYKMANVTKDGEPFYKRYISEPGTYDMFFLVGGAITEKIKSYTGFQFREVTFNLKFIVQ